MAVRDWSQRCVWRNCAGRPTGQRIVATDLFLRRPGGGGHARFIGCGVDDGLRSGSCGRACARWSIGGPGGPGGEPPGAAASVGRGGPERRRHAAPFAPRLAARPGRGGVPGRCCSMAVGRRSVPVVRRLTRRLESLKKGVEISVTFGASQLDHHRVGSLGFDEVDAVAASLQPRRGGRVEASGMAVAWRNSHPRCLRAPCCCRQP